MHTPASWTIKSAGRDRANDTDILARLTAGRRIQLYGCIVGFLKKAGPSGARGAVRGQAPVDKVTGPLGPRRGIAGALRQLREDHGKLLNEVS